MIPNKSEEKLFRVVLLLHQISCMNITRIRMSNPGQNNTSLLTIPQRPQVALGKSIRNLQHSI